MLINSVFVSLLQVWVAVLWPATLSSPTKTTTAFNSSVPQENTFRASGVPRQDCAVRWGWLWTDWAGKISDTPYRKRGSSHCMWTSSSRDTLSSSYLVFLSSFMPPSWSNQRCFVCLWSCMKNVVCLRKNFSSIGGPNIASGYVWKRCSSHSHTIVCEVRTCQQICLGSTGVRCFIAATIASKCSFLRRL